jgi:hypothetical protein
LLVKAKLLNLVNKFVDDYYQTKTHDNTISFETSSPNFNYTYTFSFLQSPSYVADSGVTYYYKGNLKRSKSLKFLSGADEEYVFNPKDGNSQIFISYQVLKSLFTDISTSQRITFDLNEKNRLIEFKFLLNVDFLGQIVPAIYNTKTRDERIHIKGNFGDLNFNANTAVLSTKVNFDVYDSKESLIFGWNNDVNFKFSSKASVLDSGLNFIVNSFTLSDTTVTNNNYGAVDEQTLSGWVEDSIESYISKYIFNLFKTNINIGKFMKISAVVEKGTGLLLIGN